jgi:hypothetical protein
MSGFEKAIFCIGRARRYFRKHDQCMAEFWISAALGFLGREDGRQ